MECRYALIMRYYSHDITPSNEMIQVYWDSKNSCWDKTIEDIKRLGTIITSKVIFKANRMVYLIKPKLKFISVGVLPERAFTDEDLK